MFKYGFENFSNQVLLTAGQTVSTAPVAGALNTEDVELVAGSEVSAILPKNPNSRNIRQIIHIDDDITAPVDAGKKLGYVEYYREDTLLGRAPLTTPSFIPVKPTPQKTSGLVRNVITFFAALLRTLLLIASLILFVPLIRWMVRSVQRTVRTKDN